MQSIDETKEIDIPEIVIHKNKKVTFDDEKKSGRTSAIPSKNKESYRLARDISMTISFTLSFSIVCLVYYFINVELYKRHRNCRDDLINDEVMAM